MSTLRRLHQITRLMLVWFVLTITASVAAPLFQDAHAGQEAICSSGGPTQWVPSSQQDSTPTHDHGLHCPLCITFIAPPTVQSLALAQPAPVESVISFSEQVFIPSATAPPLPSRGPPLTS